MSYAVLFIRWILRRFKRCLCSSVACYLITESLLLCMLPYKNTIHRTTSWLEARARNDSGIVAALSLPLPEHTFFIAFWRNYVNKDQSEWVRAHIHQCIYIYFTFTLHRNFACSPPEVHTHSVTRTPAVPSPLRKPKWRKRKLRWDNVLSAFFCVFSGVCVREREIERVREKHTRQKKNDWKQ